MAEKTNGNVADKQEYALRVSHLSKSFKLPTESANSIKVMVVNWAKGKRGYTIQHVLNDISFEVKRGEFFGICGKNGSGKSTLLKLISQIYYPDEGSIDVRGKLVPFIELGVGFNPELTGRDNVYLNGAMLGFSKSEVDAMYDDIVEFAELGDFMEQKLKNYSSGMQVRLAFSVAIKSQGDILVLDEVLAVGDEAFQRKCQDYFFEAKRQKKTIILVTHSMPDVRRYCDRAMFIQDGHIAKIGDPDEVADAYTYSFLPKNDETGDDDTASDAGLTVPAARVLVEGEPQSYLAEGEDFTIEVDLECTRPIKGKDIFIDVVDGRQVPVLSIPLSDSDLVLEPGKHTVVCGIPGVIAFGDFCISIALQTSDVRKIVALNVKRFHIKGLAGEVIPVMRVPADISVS